MILLEKLIALFLTGTLLTGFAYFLNGEHTLSHQNRNLNRELHNTIRIYSIITHIQNQLDTHRYPLLPVIHREGRVTYFDGSPHELSLRNDHLAIKLNSDAITFVQLSHIAPIVPRSNQTPCMQTGIPHHSLAYTGDFIFEAIIFWQEGCSPRISKIPTNSLITQQLDSEFLPSPNAFLLLRSITTLYVSKQDVLRLVQHRGDSVIENQPLLNDSPTFMLELNRQSDSAGELSVTLFSSLSRKQFKQNFPLVLSRHSFDQLLLQTKRIQF